jgi:hypothetical protein
VPVWDNNPTQRPTGYMLRIKYKGLLIPTDMGTNGV